MIPIIILAIENDDDRVFMEGLYLSYNRLMRSEIYKILKDSWATEDVEQNVLEKLIDKIPLLRTMDRARLVNYIIVSSRNNAYNYLRDNKKITMFSFDDEVDSANINRDNGSRTPIQLWEASNHLREAWEKLDERSKYVLNLKYTLLKDDAEIARDLGISTPSVRMTVSRARQKLKNVLDEAEAIV